jgi:hypothetical protein
LVRNLQIILTKGSYDLKVRFNQSTKGVKKIMADDQRGFAKDPQKASEAGKKAHEEGKAHEFDSQEASDAAKMKNQGDGSNWEEEEFMVISDGNLNEDAGDGSSKRGMGSPNYDPKTAEEAREEGGRNSHDGENPSEDEE